MERTPVKLPPGDIHGVELSRKIRVPAEDGFVYARTDIDKIPDDALIICINCDNLSSAKDWRRKDLGLTMKGKCFECGSTAWEVWDGGEKIPFVPRHTESEEEESES